MLLKYRLKKIRSLNNRDIVVLNQTDFKTTNYYQACKNPICRDHFG